MKSTDTAAPQRSMVDLSIQRAIESSVRAFQPAFIHLPTPVRLRASNAIGDWTAARRAAGQDGERLRAMIANPDAPLLSLLRHMEDFIQRHSTLPFDTPDRILFRRAAVQSVYWQAFWLRDGALYEPTPALSRLLHTTDIGADIPVSMLRLPCPAMCLVPEPAIRVDKDGFEAIAVFEHKLPADATHSPRGLTFVIQTIERTDVVSIQVRDDQQTIAQAFDVASQTCTVNSATPLDLEALRSRTLQRLDYVAKMLLYLSLDKPEIAHETPYSAAPRLFPGLGKRKRELRLAEVEQLYDRYLIGPSGLGSSGHSVSAHWRRGHFRLQPHGPKSSLRKVMFIMPIIVRADRLADDTPTPPGPTLPD